MTTLPHRDYSPDATNSLAARLWQILSHCIFLLPVALVPVIFSSLNTNTIVIKETVLQFSLIWIILILPIIWIQDHFYSPKSISWKLPNHLFTILLALLVYLFISSTWISGHPRAAHEFLKWACYILLVLVTVPFIVNRRRFHLYLTVTVITALVISIYAIGQAFEIDYIYKDWDPFLMGVAGVRRVCGSMGNPDFLAGYLVGIIPLTLVLSLSCAGYLRFTLLVIAFIELIAMFYTYSRGAALSLCAANFLLFISLAFLWIKNPALMRPVMSKRSAIVCLCVLIIFGLCIGVFMWDAISVNLIRFTQLGDDVSTLTRPYFWGGALEMWKAHPITGLGIGTFTIFFPEFRSQKLASLQPFKDFYVEHTHCEYLEILAETGLIGFGLYALFFIAFTIYIWKFILRNTKWESLVLLGLWTGMVGILIHNLFTVTLRFTPSAFILWSFCGVAIGVRASMTHTDKPSSLWFKSLISILLLAAVPYLFISGVKNYVGDYQIRQAKEWLSKCDIQESQRHNHELLEKAFTALHKSIERAPHNITSHVLLGLAYHKVYDYSQAIESYKRLESLQKDFTTNRLNIGISYMKQSDLIGGASYLPSRVQPFPVLSYQCLNNAQDWLKQAIQSDPEAPEYHLFLGRTYYHQGFFEKAENEFSTALRYSESRKFTHQSKSDPVIDAMIELGRAYFYQNKFQEARKSFLEALQKNKNRTPDQTDMIPAFKSEINKYLNYIKNRPKQ